MKRVVVFNAYGLKNIGDAAICTVALRHIDKLLKGREVIYGMFTDKDEDFTFYNVKSRIVNVSSPYGIAIESKGRPVSRCLKLLRFLQILPLSLLLTVVEPIKSISLSERSRYRFIKAIRDSDAIIGMGGGYIRTKNKYADYFGLLLTLLPVYIAKYYKKPILFLPMSFGNFASDTHRKIAFNALKGTTIICRDRISLAELKRMDRGKNELRFTFAPDLALSYNLVRKIDITKKFSNKYIVLTARKWLSPQKQRKYEDELVKLILYVWQKYNLKTHFISMATNPAEDDDHKVASYLAQIIPNKKIFDTSKARSPAEVQKILHNAKAAICTRMHSAILAANVCTLFITIGYEYKTRGLMQFLDLEEWNTDINDANSINLSEKFKKLMQSSIYRVYVNKLKDSAFKISKYNMKTYSVMKEIV